MIVGINKGYCWVGSQCSVKLQRLLSIWNFRGNNLPTYIRLVLKTFRAVLLKGPLPNTNPLIPWFLIFFLCWRFWGLSPCQSVPPPHTHPPIHEAKTSFTSSTTLHCQRHRSNFPMTNTQVLRQKRKYEKYKKEKTRFEPIKKRTQKRHEPLNQTVETLGTDAEALSISALVRRR